VSLTAAPRGTRFVASGLFALWAAAAPGLARACPVCSAGSNDAGQSGFLMGTIFLSVLPLALIGGIAWWIHRRAREIAVRDAAPPHLAAR
jgi:hypothetical protein